MILFALQPVDLLAFVALGLTVAVVVLVLVGVGLWLRTRQRRPGESGYYPGL